MATVAPSAADAEGGRTALGKVWLLLRLTGEGFIEDDAWSRGASIAYFTLFSVAPTLLVVIAVAGLVFGQDAAQGAIVGQLSGLMGRETAEALAGDDPQRLGPPERHAGDRDRAWRHPARDQRRIRRGPVGAERGMEGQVAQLDNVAPGAGAAGEPRIGHRLRLRVDGVARRQRGARRLSTFLHGVFPAHGGGPGRRRFRCCRSC